MKGTNTQCRGEGTEYSYGTNLVHIIFSTKYRQNIIQPDVEPDLFAYMGGIANNNRSKLLAAGGTEDHVHLLASLSKNIALSEFVGDINPIAPSG